MVDAEQFICGSNKLPDSIPTGTYEKAWRFNPEDQKSDIIMKQWGVDGKYGFIKIKNGDWIVKFTDSKYFKVYDSESFQDKFEKSIWQN